MSWTGAQARRPYGLPPVGAAPARPRRRALVLVLLAAGLTVTALLWSVAGLPPERPAGHVESPHWLGTACLAAGGAVAAMVLIAARRRTRAVAAAVPDVRGLVLDLMGRVEGGAPAELWSGLLDALAQVQRELDTYRYRHAAAEGELDVRAVAARELLEGLPLGVLHLDDTDHVQYANSAVVNLLQARGLPAGRVSLEEFAGDATVVETLRSLRQNLPGTNLDCQFQLPGGPALVRLTRLPLPAGELGLAIQDVAPLKQSARAHDEFLAHLTHELRTPLTNIRAYAETLRGGVFDDEQTRRECFDVIMQETRRLSRLIEDVLSVSQIDAGAARLQRVPVRLDESLAQVVQELQAAADAKGLELVLQLPASPPLVVGDRFRLNDVWAHLIGNAIKYTPAGGTVRIVLSAAPGAACVQVCDTGPGIDARWHQRIFEKFFRLESLGDETPGTGLGLAIVAEVVRLHGGSVRVDSTPGAGATFTVELPVPAHAPSPNTDHSPCAGDANGRA